MSFQRKLRKFVLHPVAFFRDSKLFGKQNVSPAGEIKKTVKNIDYSAKLEIETLRIVNFTNIYPVNSLRWKDGQILWPAFRFYLTLLANSYVRGQLKTARIFQPFPSPQWRKYHLEDDSAIPIDAYDPKEQYDFLVFSGLRSISWVDDGEKIQDRIFDPLIERLQQYGKTKKITIITASGKVPNKFATTPDCILFPAQYTVHNFYDVNDFDAFANHFITVFKHYKVTKGDLGYFLDVFIYLYTNYMKLLKKVKPKAIFFFPINFSTPLIMAARALNIHAVDIQHGNMIGYYPAYNRWEEQHKKGYDLWPDAFLSWGEREKKHIHKEFKGHIKPIIFGYPWLDMPISFEQELKNKSIEKFCSRFKYIVIISLSEEKYISNIMEDIIRDLRAEELSIGFIFKRRPKKKTIIPKLHNTYTENSLTNNSFINVAKYANLHVTTYSSCLYEADYIGLNTITLGNDWELHFKDLVEAERIYTAQSADDFYTIFTKAVSFCHYPRLIDNHTNEFEQFMRTFAEKN